jgi:hypothetical protein
VNRRLPIAVCLSALLSLTVTLVVPLIVTWQSRNLLHRFGAEDVLGMMVNIRLDTLKFDRIASALFGATALIGSVLMLRAKPLGKVLAVAASGLWLASSCWALYSGNHVLPLLGPIVRGLWWGTLLVLLVRQQSSLNQNLCVPGRG